MFVMRKDYDNGVERISPGKATKSTSEVEPFHSSLQRRGALFSSFSKAPLVFRLRRSATCLATTPAALKTLVTALDRTATPQANWAFTWTWPGRPGTASERTQM